MTLNRQVALNECQKLFSILVSKVKIANSLHLFDTAKLSEDFYSTLCHVVYDLRLVNLNVLKANHPAVDLADESNKLAIQVTTTFAQSKIADTVEMFEKHALDKKYDTLQVLFIDHRTTNRIPSGKSYKIEVKFIEDILDDISALHTGRIEQVVQFLESEIQGRDSLTPEFKRHRLRISLPKEIAIKTEEETYLITDLLESKVISGAIHRSFLEIVGQLCLELAENVFKHNRGQQPIVHFAIYPTQIVIQHTEGPFNPEKMKHLPPEKTGCGTRILLDFINAFRRIASMSYQEGSDQGSMHTITIAFSDPITHVVPIPKCTIYFNELANTNLFSQCSTVFVIPPKSIVSTSRITGLLSGISLPPQAKLGFALRQRNDYLIGQLKRLHPGLPILLMDTDEVI